MTRQDLDSVRDLKLRAWLLAQSRASLLATAEDLVPITDNMPRPKDMKSRTERLAIKILEVGEELEKVREQIIRAETKLAEQIVAEVNNPALQKLAILRYVKCLSYKEISHSMKYTLRYIYILHDKFLKHFISSSS